jgi:hypothetical protein
MNKSKGRGLSKRFREDLKKGILAPFLELVRNDATLCLQIREDYINIYYRGGNILRITEKRYDKGEYLAWFDKKYISSNSIDYPKRLIFKHDITSWISIIPVLKQEMCRWFAKHPKEEREFQQVIVYENNSLSIGSSTDYFIIDIEYDNHEGARFDMMAVRWDSDSISRKLQKGYKPGLTFIEMKYADNALSGNAGILKHIEDLKRYIKDHGFKGIHNEMLSVFAQQRELELIPALRDNNKRITKFSDDVEYLFILANHDPASQRLHNTLNKVIETYGNKDLGFNLRFCVGNFMGYSLYKENIYSLSDFMSRFERQIICKS